MHNLSTDRKNWSLPKAKDQEHPQIAAGYTGSTAGQVVSIFKQQRRNLHHLCYAEVI